MALDRDVAQASAAYIKRGVQDRQHLLRCETEDFLRSLFDSYPARRAGNWKPDYSSVPSFLASVEANRKRWQDALGAFGPAQADMGPQEEPFLKDRDTVARWVTLRVSGNLRAHAILGLPAKARGKVPLVICQHGIGSSPERTFGFDDDSEIYHAYARRLTREGFAVLAPMHVTEAKPRARLHRLCLMLGGTLWGLEVFKLRRLLDYALSLREIDARRVGMWGISLGGAYTQIAMPLEPRIQAGISCAWFNHRVRKMAFDDPRYSCFLSVEEEHIFIPGWLREFSDGDLFALICPRPMQVQTGKADGISWWPFVAEEFDRAREHYDRLGLSDRIEWDLHEGGHEIRFDAGLRFLDKWLRRSDPRALECPGGGRAARKRRGEARRG